MASRSARRRKRRTKMGEGTFRAIEKKKTVRGRKRRIKKEVEVLAKALKTRRNPDGTFAKIHKLRPRYAMAQAMLAKIEGTQPEQPSA